MTKKSPIASIAKNDPLILMLRRFMSFCYEEKHSHANWLWNHEFGVKGAGRVLRFLNLAEPDEQSCIGWKAKPRFFELAKKAEALALDSDESFITEEDEVLIDMLDGIAAGAISLSDCNFLQRERWVRIPAVLTFVSCVLEGLGLLTMGEFKPTPLLHKMFVEAVLRNQKAANVDLVQTRVVRSRAE
jgi:hypothetical protein